jgi:hypothetical protein
LPIAGGEYGFADGDAMLQDIVGPEANGRIPLLSHEFVATTVVGAVRVLGAIDFDDQSFLSAAEICEVRTNGMLPCEMVAAEFAALQF